MAATQWSQKYQQYQHQPQHYQQPQQYAQGQQYQHPQQYQHNQQYQAQQYQHQQQPQGYAVQQYHHNPQYQGYHYQQPQQGQPMQQYQQAGQCPPVAQQYPQSQPSHPTQKYPQQQFQQPQQGHNGYQHPNVPAHYPSQPYAPQQQTPASHHGPHPMQTSPQQSYGSQQHGTSQYGTHQQVGQLQRNPAQRQSHPQTTPQACFNCGNAGHFAMDCPEPIRAIPAGKANPQAFQNPLRRPKNVGTAANSPQYASRPNHTQASPKGYPSPPYGQTGYSQYPQCPQASSATRSPSVHSPGQAQCYQQWQQYYQSQQAYQQGNHHHQASPYHQQPYAPPHGQPIGCPDGLQKPNHTSIQASQPASGAPTYQSQLTPTSTSPLRVNRHYKKSFTMDVDPPNEYLASRDSQSNSKGADETQILDYDFEEDNLNSLDVPDLPSTTLPFVNASRQSISLISQPLPGNSIVADALAPFPSPAPQDEGRCRSKYQYNADFNAYLEHFQDSKYWDKEHADDVVFSDLPSDGKIVPVNEVLWMIRQRRMHPESSDVFKRTSRSQSRTVSMTQDSLDVNTTLDRVERELAETKAKLQAKLEKGRAADPSEASPLRSIKVEQSQLRDHNIKQEYQTPPQSATSEKPIKTEQDAEDVLAALGVTGAPKAVTTTAWPDQYNGYGSPNDMRVSRSGSSSRADILSEDQHSAGSSSNPVTHEYHPNGPVSRKQCSAPPPPPPTPFGQRSHQDGTYNSPLSTGTSKINVPGHSTNGVDHGNGNSNGFFSPSTDGQAPSPVETRSEKSHNRKRHRDSSSGEEDTPNRRQEDDYTPKLKKRQPKVAEAYSRRW